MSMFNVYAIQSGHALLTQLWLMSRIREEEDAIHTVTIIYFL